MDPLQADRLRPGSVLAGRYKLLVPLGRGGMGAVYGGEDLQTGQRVAVKVLHSDAMQKSEAVARFLQEAEATARAAHPNIVSVVSAGREQQYNTLYIVQEMLEGDDLRRRLDVVGRMSPDEALTIMIPVMSALAAAHKQGVIHRDVKPENIVLAKTPQGEIPKLIDFGISRMADEEGVAQTFTRTGMTVGTPQYMSPEQVRGERDLDARTDVWAAAVVLYELLAGRVPHRASDYAVLVDLIMHEPVPRIEKYAPHVPPQLAQVLHAALEMDRKKRYRDMNAFLDALSKCPFGKLANDYSSTQFMMAVPPPEALEGSPANTSPVLPSWAPKPLSPGEAAPRKKSSPGAKNAASKGKKKKRTKRDEQIRMAVIALLITVVAVVGGILGFRAGAMLGPSNTPSATPSGAR